MLRSYKPAILTLILLCRLIVVCGGRAFTVNYLKRSWVRIDMYGYRAKQKALVWLQLRRSTSRVPCRTEDGARSILQGTDRITEMASELHGGNGATKRQMGRKTMWGGGGGGAQYW
jgi:hypothetical protein